MNVEIRDIEISDLPEIVRLNDGIQRQHVEAYPDDFLYPVDQASVSAFFASLIDNADQSVLIATIEDKAVAYFWYERQRARPNPFTRPKDRLFVHHIYVMAPYQRRGVARLFMNHVDAVARSENIHEIALDTWMGNAGAKAFFEAQGYEHYRAFLRKSTASD